MLSSRSITDITKPKPEDNRSTLLALFLNRFKNPCKKATLATDGIKCCFFPSTNRGLLKHGFSFKFTGITYLS